MDAVVDALEGSGPEEEAGEEAMHRWRSVLWLLLKGRRHQLHDGSKDSWEVTEEDERVSSADRISTSTSGSIGENAF